MAQLAPNPPFRSRPERASKNRPTKHIAGLQKLTANAPLPILTHENKPTPHPRIYRHPADRPTGIPGNARFAGAGIAFAIIFIAVNAIAVAAGNDMTIYGTLATYAFAPLIITAITAIALLDTGKLRLIRVFRRFPQAVTVVDAAAIRDPNSINHRPPKSL